MVSRRFRFAKNQQDEIIQAILLEDSQTLERLGFTPGTVKQYIAFVKMAKKDSAGALKAYPRLSKTITHNIISLISIPDIIRNYKETIQTNLRDIGIAEIFNILNATQKLINDLQLEPIEEDQDA